MKRIKQIIEAVKVLRDDPPAMVIRDACEHIETYLSNAMGDGSLQESDVELMTRIMRAVADAAEDMEKPAKSAEGEAK